MEADTKNRTSNKNIILGSLIGYITIGVNIVFGFLSIPLIIKMVGDSGYGLFTLATSVINVFVIDFGLGTAANHHLSKALANNDDEHFKDTASLIFRIFILMDIIFGIVILFLLVFSKSIFTGLTAGEIVSFRGVFLIVGVFSLIALPSTIFNSILSAHEKFFFIKSINLLTRILYIGVVLTVLLLGGGLLGLVLSHVLTELSCILIKYIYVRAKLKTKILLTRRISKDEKKMILGFSIWACAQALCNRISFNLAPSILGITSNSKQIAIFGVVATFENYISMIASVMSGFFLPRINRIKNSKNALKELEELSHKVGKIQGAIVLLVLIGFASCGKEFITLWIHSTTSYTDVYIGTLIVAIPNLVFCPQLVLYTAMFTDKKSMMHLAIAALIKALIFLGLIFPLSTKYGAIGAAFTILIAKTVEIILQNVFYKLDLRVSLRKFYSKTFASLLIPSIVSLCLGLMIHFSNDGNLMKMIKTIIIVTLTFVTFSIMFLSNKERQNYKELIKSFINRKK